MIFIGKTYRIIFPLMHPETGVAITGHASSIEVLLIDESGNETEPTATELGHGLYYYDLTPDAEGPWAVKFKYEGVTPIQTGTFADYAIPDQDAKLDTIDGVVDSNHTILAHGTYGLSALKTLIDTKASSSALATVDGNVDTLLTRITGAAALEATLTAMKGAGWSSETLKAIYDLVNAPANYKADVSALATAASLTTVGGNVSTLLSRLSAARAGYLNNLNNAELLNIPDLSTLSSTRIAYLDQLDFNLNERLGSPAGDSLAADLATIDAQTDKIREPESDTTSSPFTLQNNTDEQTIIEETPSVFTKYHGVMLDINALTKTVSAVKVYFKVDGSNYRENVSMRLASVPASIPMLLLKEFSSDVDWKVTIQMSEAEGATRSIPYRILKEENTT